jgi:aspartate kinase
VAVVVSAMAGHTNQLVAWVTEACRLHDAREYDAVVASGEQVTGGLLALALQNLGVNARSWLGWQIPVRTDGVHGKARIEDIDTQVLIERMKQGQVAVVAGFQGIGPDNRITTLGRGGSDTSAVALAAALKADRCDIFTDVDGVYTTDPRIVAKARKLDKITYEEMLEMASQGAKVLQTRSVELAMRYKVRLRVLSSFEDTDENSGTLVCDEDEIMESKVVSGVAYSRDEAKMTLIKVEDRPGVAAAIFGSLADAGVNVDMIVQNISEQDDPTDKRAHTDMTFSLPTNQVDRAKKAIEEAAAAGKFVHALLVTDSDVAKVSVVGIGMRSQVGVAARMFAALAAENVNIKVITTSEIKISVLIDRKYMELAVQALHDTFELDKA